MVDGSMDAKTKKSQITDGQQLERSMRWVLDKVDFRDVKLHGHVKWVPVQLVYVAIFWVWSSKRLLVDSAKDAIEKVAEIFGPANIRSYQVLTNALIKYGDEVMRCVVNRMQTLMEQVNKSRFRIGCWVVLAVDGSRLDAPRTRANEVRFCKPKATKKKKNKKKGSKRGRHAKARKPASKKSHYQPQPVGPQVWLTLLWHVASRMPWAWKIGPSYSSERGHLLEMLSSVNFPAKSMICGDAGFVGYEFWKAIDTAGHRFLCRVGSNCKFLKLAANVRYKNGLVYCWPKEQQAKGQPPLTLRLLCFNDGRGEVYLVTNELDTRLLSDSLASEIYRKRWGIEVQIRSLKQTFGRSKLQGRTPEVAVVELNWSILGLWMAQLFAMKEQTELMEPGSQTSVAMVLRIIQSILQRPDKASGQHSSLSKRLRNACTDSYSRSSRKKSRNYPRRKEEPRTGPPKVNVATREQRNRINELLSLQQAA